MTSLIQNFLAARAAKEPKPPVANAAQSVTRAEFNTLVQAVHGLIEDIDAATSPEKLQAALNSALKPFEQSTTMKTNVGKVSGKYRLPGGDDDIAPIANKSAGKFIAPAGE